MAIGRKKKPQQTRGGVSPGVQAHAGSKPTGGTPKKGPKPIGVDRGYGATAGVNPGATFWGQPNKAGQWGGDVNAPLNFGFGTVTAGNIGAMQAHGLLAPPALAQGVAPRYVGGDTQMILSQLVGTDDLASLQARMKAAGFMYGKYQVGGWDSKTQTALGHVLNAANVLGLSYDDLLNSQLFQGRTATGSGGGGGRHGGGGGGGSATAGVLNLDPEQVRQVVDKTGQDVIGKNLDPAMREQITNEVMTEAQDSISGKKSTPFAYDVNSEIRKKIKEQHPGQALETDYTNAANSFFSMLGAGGIFGRGVQAPDPATGAVMPGMA